MSVQNNELVPAIERVKYRDLLERVAVKLDRPRSEIAPIADVFLDEFIKIFESGNLLKLGPKGTFKTKSQNEWVINIKYARPNTKD